MANQLVLHTRAARAASAAEYKLVGREKRGGVDRERGQRVCSMLCPHFGRASGKKSSAKNRRRWVQVLKGTNSEAKVT
jgi:hypothetical protein